MIGHRITWKGAYAQADAGTLTALHTALQAPPYSFTPIGLPVRRTFGAGVAATAMYEQGMFMVLCTGGTLNLTAMIRGSVDRSALKALITSTFGLTGETTIEDEADL